jgi:hypothetical protein
MKTKTIATTCVFWLQTKLCAIIVVVLSLLLILMKGIAVDVAFCRGCFQLPWSSPIAVDVPTM